MEGNPSWLYNHKIPINQYSAPTQATAFATSSLASASTNYVAYDGGRQDFSLQQATGGNRHKNNLNIIDEDKSNIGIENALRAQKIFFSKPDPRALTVPYVYVENRSNLLR